MIARRSGYAWLVVVLAAAACDSSGSAMQDAAGGGGLDAMSSVDVGAAADLPVRTDGAPADAGADLAAGDTAGADAAPTGDAPGADAAGDVAPPADAAPATDAAPTDTTPAVSCTPGRTCADPNTLAVCEPSGTALRMFPCPSGCETTDEAHCKPAVLSSGWTIFRFPLSDDSVQTQAAYAFESDGLVAIQTANALPSAYVNDQPIERVKVTGRFSVQTGSDDDLVGFVFGWQDEKHFYLLDWKQAAQNDGTCGLAAAGVALKRVSSDVAVNTCASFWKSEGTPAVTTLSAPALNPAGWVDSKVYDFELSWKPGDIRITIRDGATVVATVTSNDATYARGKFGFYNYSQEQVRYEFFSINPAE